MTPISSSLTYSNRNALIGSTRTARLFVRFAENQANGPNHPPPAPGSCIEFFPSLACEPVKLCLAVVLTHSPLRRNQATVLKPMECGIERSLFHVECIF